MIWSISRDDKRFRKRTEDEKLFSVVQVGKYLFWIQRPNQSNTFCSKTKKGGIINGRSAAHVRFPEYWLLFAICEMEGQVKLPLTCLSLRAPPCIGPKSCCSSGRSESPKVGWNCEGTPGRGRHNSLELGVLVVITPERYLFFDPHEITRYFGFWYNYHTIFAIFYKSKYGQKLCFFLLKARSGDSRHLSKKCVNYPFQWVITFGD